jgi:hypothetical protein
LADPLEQAALVFHPGAATHLYPKLTKHANVGNGLGKIFNAV